MQTQIHINKRLLFTRKYFLWSAVEIFWDSSFFKPEAEPKMNNFMEQP